MSEDLSDLVAISRARFQAEEAKLQDILWEERRLRLRVRALEDQHRAAQSELSGQTAGQRSYGGDVLWQGWVARSRRQLQIELAQVLMRKGQMMTALRRAHGRKTASESLWDEADSKRHEALLKKQIEREQALILLDRFAERPGD